MPPGLSLDHSVRRNIQMISRLTAEFFRMRSIELNLRGTGKRTHRECDLGRLKACARKELASILREQIQMTRAARVRRLARCCEQRGADPAPPHRFTHVQRAYQRRVDLRLDADHADRLVADVRDDIARCRPLDSLRYHPGARKHRVHPLEISRLLDYEFACAMLAYRHAA